MATLSNLSTSTLALKGAGTEYNYLQRFFATKAEADAALSDGSWVPTAGKLNGCLTGDQGLLVYNEGTSSLDLADEATRAYVDAQIGALVDGAPGTLDTLNELAAAINDNPNYFTDAEAARQANTNLINAETSRATAAEAAIQADVDQNEADADAAIAAVQADVDQNEADADAADAALDARLVVLEADPTTATAVAAVQADVDQNEADADAAIAAEEARALAAEALLAPLASPILTGTPQAPTANAGTSTTQLATTAFVSTAVANLVDNAPGTLDTLNEIAVALGNDANLSTTLTNSIAAVQADVDQNELDSDTADAALGVRIDNVETEIDTARTNIYAALGRTEGVQSMGTFTGSLLGDNQTVKDLLQTLETKAESLDLLKANLTGATFTGDIVVDEGTGSTIKLETSGVTSAGIHIEGPSGSMGYLDTTNGFGNDSLQIYSANTWCRAINGGTGNLIVDGTLTLAGTALTATFAELNYVDGVTSNVQTQLDAIQADVDQNESDADTAIAAVQADVDQNEIDSDAADAAIVDGTTNFTGFQLQGTAVTANGAELNYVDVTAVGTAEANKAMVLDAGKSISGINSLTCVDLTVQGTTTTVDTVTMQATNAIAFEGATADSNETTLTIIDPDADRTIKLPNQSGCLPVLAADSNTAITATPEELNLLDGVTATTAELNFVDGVTSAIQDQLDAIQADVNQNESDADSAIAANEAHVDNLVALSGVAKDQVHLSTFTGSTIVDNRTVKAALQDLETAVETKLASSAVSTFGGTLIDDADAAAARTTLGLGSAATTDSGDYATAAQGATADAALPAAGAQAALSVDHLITLSGVAEGSDDFGTFTGSTIGDNLALKAILQAVETAVEARLATTGVTTLLSEYANDGAAETGGVPVGGLYYDGNGHVRVRLV